jgi:hypothetical protein
MRLNENAVIETENLPAALELAGQHPHRPVRMFASDWGAVDRARLWVAAAGLVGRVTVHHKAAREVLARPASCQCPAHQPEPERRRTA